VSVFALGCLDAVEPTPTSSLVSITPVNRSTRGDENQSGVQFRIDIRIINRGSRPIFVDRLYGWTEKLVDQKWKLVVESTNAPFVSIRSIQPGGGNTITYLMQYVRGYSPESLYLDRVRGLYRARLRLSYSASGTELLPPEESYSQPFAVE
jgi:hypothetical protein